MTAVTSKPPVERPGTSLVPVTPARAGACSFGASGEPPQGASLIRLGPGRSEGHQQCRAFARVEYDPRVEWFITWKFLHIAAMFFAVALAISGEIVVRRVAGQRDVAAIRTTIRTVKPLSGTGSTIFFVAGLAFGVLAALAGQIDLLAPWLISAYVAFGLAMLIGLTVTDPWVSRLEAAAAASGMDVPSDELVGVIDDARARAATAALMVLIVALIFIMVVKPFGG
jgi:hypothetical protein